MDINLVELWHEMGWPVRSVVIVLTLQAVGCIAVTIDRFVLLIRSGKRSKQFAAKASPMIDAGDYEKALEIASKSGGSHLASFMHTGIKTFLDRRYAGDETEKAADRTRRALERKGETMSNALNRGMGVLASTGSTAPFVGLLGTVLGILNAFKMISATGSGGLGTIGNAIAEALIVTGFGLAVAIPAVLLFNWLSTRIDKFETGLVNAASELVDRLEADDLDTEGGILEGGRSGSDEASESAAA